MAALGLPLVLTKNGAVVGGWIEMRLFVATVFWGLMMKEIKNHMKFLDLFAGIGGFRLGMESAGHECIGFCEIDKFARASYKAIHDTKGEIELHDITAVSDESIRRIGRVDIICGGFPCQAFSIAGNRRGFEDTEELCFLKLHGSHLFSDLNIYSLRTSKDSSTMTEELHLRPSSEPWMNWGTMWNGKILTAKILESPKTGSACSLSAILEENVPEEFFLSQKVASKLLQSKNSTAIPLQPDTETHKAQGRTLLKVNRRK